MKKGLKVNTIAWIAAAVVLIAAVPINMIFSKVDVKVDVTPYSAYSLSDKANQALSSLEKPVDMTVLYQLDDLFEGTEPGEAEYMMAKMFVTTMRQMAEFDNINLHEINIEKNPGYINEIDPDGFMNLAPGDIILECGNLKRDISFTTLFKTNSETGSIEFTGENAVIGAINYLQSGITPTIYFAEGHGEKSMDSFASFTNMLKTQNYNVKSLDIGLSGSIPEDAVTVVFAGPSKDITAEEKEILLDYAADGGDITMLISPLKDKTVFKNIEAILKTYEIGMCYNRVYETQADYRLGDDQYTILCELVDNDFNKELIDAQGSQNIYMPSSRTFYSLSEEGSTIKSESLIETFDYAMSELYGGSQTDVQTPAGKLCIAAKAEDEARNNSKIFVAGSSEFIDDGVIADIMEKSNIASLTPYLFLMSVSWMDDINSAEAMYPTRVQATDYITIPDKSTGNIILVIMIALPVLIASTGVIVWARRRNA